MGSRSMFGAALVLCAAAAAAQPPPAPDVPVNLNNRIFLDNSTIYDPVYGLGKVGIVKDRIITFVPTNIPRGEPDKTQSKDFAVYDYQFDKGGSGGVSIPIIGSVSVSTDQMLHVTLEDITDVYLKKSPRPGACQIWAEIKKYGVTPGTVVFYTDHAVFSKLTYATADKTKADASVGIGSYFSANGNLYKDASSKTNIPLISVYGDHFTVDDPKTFCTSQHKPVQLQRFVGLSDLGLKLTSASSNATFKSVTQGAPTAPK